MQEHGGSTIDIVAVVKHKAGLVAVGENIQKSDRVLDAVVAGIDVGNEFLSFAEPPDRDSQAGGTSIDIGNYVDFFLDISANIAGSIDHPGDDVSGLFFSLDIFDSSFGCLDEISPVAVMPCFFVCLETVERRAAADNDEFISKRFGYD